MLKKPNRPEVEIHAMIVVDAKMRLGCKDFSPDFTLPSPTRTVIAWGKEQRPASRAGLAPSSRRN